MFTRHMLPLFASVPWCIAASSRSAKLPVSPVLRLLDGIADEISTRDEPAGRYDLFQQSANQ